MKEIQLSRGKVALVDDEDFKELNKFKWYAGKTKEGLFDARRNLRVEQTGKRTTLLMHRIVMRTEVGGEVDHVNHNLLDNRGENLRICTRSQNCMNKRKKASTSSRFKGVSFHGKSGRWEAYIKKDGMVTYLGLRKSEEDAARLYDTAARQSFGEFALLNFPQGE